MFVEGDYVVFMWRSLGNLSNVDGLLQFLHVLLIVSDVQNRCQWFCEFYWKGYELRTEKNGSVQTASVAGIIVFVTSVQGDPQNSFIVFLHCYTDVDVSSISIGNSMIEAVTV